MGRWLAISAVVWGLLLHGVGPAHGQAESADGQAAAPMAAEQMAREAFTQGAAAYDAGNYQEALDHFQRAYGYSPRPKLLFNIGQSADRLRMDDLALASFRQYLAELPQADNREQVENRVRALEAVIAEREAREAAQAEREAAAQNAQVPEASVESGSAASAAGEGGAAGDDPQGLPWVPVAAAGVGAVLIGVGAGVGAAARADEEDYGALPVTTEAEARAASSAFDDADKKALIANVLIVGGAAVVVGAAIWLALDLGSRDAELAALPMLGPDTVGLSLRGHFGGRP